MDHYKPKALLISGYHAVSQKHWADYTIATCNDFAWTLIALPPRYFAWRMRGAPLSIHALNEPALNEHYDLIVATSSVDLSIVQSLYPALRNTYSILYFHDNQFAYPKAHQPQSVIDWQMVNLYSAIRADKVLFNSQYNKHSFNNGAQKLLKKLPDLVPKHLIEKIESKADILCVPIKNRRRVIRQDKNQLTILWNHRWEWDKNPALLGHIAKQLTEHKVRFKLVLTGQQFRNIPEAMTKLLDEHTQVIEHAGFIEDESDYQKMIEQCDIVLSTAIHEFQGISVMEAVHAGCVPLLPNRLSYPEFFDSEFLYDSEKSLEHQANSACQKIISWQKKGLPEAPTLKQFTESTLRKDYQAAMQFKAI